MSLTGKQLALQYHQHTERAADLVQAYADLLEQVRVAKAKLAPQLDAVLKDLAEAYLPTLTAPALADLATRAGFKKLQRRDPLKAMARERHMLSTRVAAIEQNERYERRQWLVGTNGELTKAFVEARSMLAPWEEACDRFEQHQHFETLVNTGYDTPNYDVGWLEARYWTYWAAGDRICRELDMPDFGDDVLPAYLKVAAERSKWRDQVARAKAKVDAVHSLVQEHDTAIARRERLPEIYLQGCREAVAEFLRMADPQLLAQWNAGHAEPNRGVTLGLRRVAGLRAKFDALSEVAERGLGPMRADLAARGAKFRRKAQKFSRTKNYSARHPDSYADTKFEDKSKKYMLRAQQAGLLIERLSSYEQYDQFDVAENAPELWFREMTGKRPSRMFPRLRSWYDRQGNAKPVRARDARPAAQAVSLMSTQDDLGYIS